MRVLDNDLSRVLASYAAFTGYGAAPIAEYRLISRGQNWPFDRCAISVLVDKIQALKQAANSPAPGDLEYLGALGYFSDQYLASVARGVRASTIHVCWDTQLDVSIVGPWHEAALITTPVLSIVYEWLLTAVLSADGVGRLRNTTLDALRLLDQADPARTIRFSELGTRRRVSLQYQLDILSDVLRLAPERLVGTGNPVLSSALGIPVLAMMHHDYVLGAVALKEVDDVARGQREAFIDWHQMMSGRFDVALSDTFGLQSFLEAFGPDLATLYSAVRHDSGPSDWWVNSVCEHLSSIGVECSSRSFVFTDSLRWPDLIRIRDQVAGRAKTTFGLGGCLVGLGSGDEIDLSLKLVKIGPRSVAKRTDDPRKNEHPFRPIPRPSAEHVAID